MKKNIKKLVPKRLLHSLYRIYHQKQLTDVLKNDVKNYKKYSFGISNNINTLEQLEARLIKAYHSIEKGLSYQDIRLGFGKSALEDLIAIMKTYKSMNYPLDNEIYQTALSNLTEYVSLHEDNKFDVSELRVIIKELGGKPNLLGGTDEYSTEDILKSLNKDFKDFSNSRRSVRDYSNRPVDLELIKKAAQLAQNAPSACNRQGWKVRVISDEEIKKIIQKNQNGNRGFGHNIDKFLLVTSDYQYYSKPRERNQAQIDGGMYAINLLYALHYYGLATIPLSASLLPEQEKNIRKALLIEDSELFVLFIGIGNYVEGSTFKVPKSTRRDPSLIYFTENENT